MRLLVGGMRCVGPQGIHLGDRPRLCNCEVRIGGCLTSETVTRILAPSWSAVRVSPFLHTCVLCTGRCIMKSLWQSMFAFDIDATTGSCQVVLMRV